MIRFSLFPLRSPYQKALSKYYLGGKNTCLWLALMTYIPLDLTTLRLDLILLDGILCSNVLMISYD